MEELQAPRGKGRKQGVKRVEEGRGQEEGSRARDKVRSHAKIILKHWISGYHIHNHFLI